MPQIDFAQYEYYPVLQSSVGEHAGYRHLADQVKDGLLPIFELSQTNNTTSNFDSARDAIRISAANRPFILDLSHDAAPPPYIPRDAEGDRQKIERETAAQTEYNAALQGLLNPANGFAAWRDYAAQFPNAVPVLQFTDATTQQRQVLRQASLLAADTGSIAIRINRDSGPAVPQIIASIMSVIPSADHLLLLVDCGQGRTHLANRSEYAASVMAEILALLDVSERALVRAVCLSNSFTNPNHDGLNNNYENFDWRLWRDASETFPFKFGDYAAMVRRQRTSTFIPPESRPSVVCALNESWMHYRHENSRDPQGWIDGSILIRDEPAFAAVPQCWGRNAILQAAGGNLANLDSARFWYAVKVNIHLTTQLEYAQSNAVNAGDGGDD